MTTVVDRESTDAKSIRKMVKGSLPLISTDTAEEMGLLIAVGIQRGIFYRQEDGTLITVEMAMNQDIERFMELGQELEALRLELSQEDS